MSRGSDYVLLSMGCCLRPSEASCIADHGGHLCG